MKLQTPGLCCALLFLLTVANVNAGQAAWVHYDSKHTLVYTNDDLGNHIPDFSYAGYMGGGVALPTNLPVKANMSPINGDNTATIQYAINYVSGLPMVNGFRGVVLLGPGTYEMDGSLTLDQSGVVLRGSGSSTSGTILHFVGNSRQTITLQGAGSTTTIGSSYPVTDAYVPLGSTQFDVSDASTFSVGDLVVVQRPVTQSWIDAIGMSNYWSPNGGLHFERTITSVSGNRITVDIPLFNPISQEWCTGEVYRVSDSARLTNSAVEDLRIRSDFDDFSTNWGSGRALNFDNCKDCWIQNVVVDNFYNGINSGGGTKWCTVQDCSYVSNAVPPSRAGAAAFGGAGQMILWQRCGSSDSTDYHVFVTQAAVPGPNVFLNFHSSGTGYDSGAHQRWAAGVLFDNDAILSTSGNTGIKLENRGGDGSGQGYAAGYSIIYNGDSQGIINEIPQVNHHYNWAIGSAPGATFVHRSDDGVFDATNGFVNPRSLYLEQLRERLGGTAVENIGYPLFTISTMPSSQDIIAGGDATFTVDVGDPTLMSNVVALSVDGLPAGVRASLSSNSVTGSGNVTLIVATSNSIPEGHYALTIAGANAGVTHTSVVNLAVGSFSLLANPSEVNVLAGTGTTCALTVVTNQSFSGNITFGLGGLPASASAYFSPASLPGAGNSTLVITTATNTPPGDYPVTIYGTNDNNAVSTGVTLHITRSLVAWLTFDDGTARDSSGYGNDGVLVGGASIVTDPQRGKVLSLDGSSGYVDLGNAGSLDLSSNSQATIVAWIKVALTHNHNTVLSKGEWNQAYSLLIKGDTTPPNLLWTGNPASVFSADPIALDSWTHVAVAINGSLTTFYINGRPDGDTNQDRGNPIDQTTNDVCIGREQYSGSLPAGRWFFNGEMDDVRIYNVALTESQIQQVMSNAAPSFSGNPLALAAAQAGEIYTGTLAGDASDPDFGDFLTFTKVSGPAWLNVSADGGLSGVPSQADAGTNSFVIRVTDLGGLSDETTLEQAVVPAPPRIGSVRMSAGNLILSGTNGVPNGVCYLLTSTNLALPMTNWSVVTTNSFDPNGRFDFTNTADATAPQEYYILKLQ